jgi:hypothetical protein
MIKDPKMRATIASNPFEFHSLDSLSKGRTFNTGPSIMILIFRWEMLFTRATISQVADYIFTLMAAAGGATAGAD